MAAFDEREWRSRDGLTLYARDYAASPGSTRLPVICLHGLTRNSRDFEDIAPLLAKGGRRIIVPDVRGRGRSDRDPQPKNYRPPIYARDVVEMMTALDIPRAIFLGTSMGGLIMMALAATQSRRIAAAILNDVGPEIAPEGIVRILSYVGKDMAVADWTEAAAYVERTNAVAFPDYRADDWRRLAKRTFRDGPSGPMLDYDPAIAAVPGKAPPRWARPLAWWLFQKLARHRPTLLIRGQDSDIVSADIATRMKRRVPALAIAEVPRVGHAPTLNEPAALGALERFLRDVD